MKHLGLLLLLGLASGSTGTKIDYVNDSRKLYTSEHDIVKIFAPLNAEAVNLRYRNNVSALKAWAAKDDCVDKLFFVQGDYKDDGTFESKGLFVLKTATGKATKLLDSGADIVCVDEDRKKVYFAATDGIYIYNAEKNTAEKYGSVTDNIISIAQTRTGDIFYALTAEKVLYKVTENGNKKEKVDDVKDAQQVMLDEADNLYFYDSEKRIFVKRYADPEAPLIQFTHLPENRNKIKLLRAIPDGAKHKYVPYIPVILDDKFMIMNSDGEVYERPHFVDIVPFTAHSMEGTFMFYFGYNKSILKFSVIPYMTD